jgi:hypothetical protein
MLKQILNELQKIEGVNSAILFGNNGTLVDQSSNNHISTDALGVLAYKSISTSIELGSGLNRGNCEQVIVELENGPIILSPIDQNKFVAVIASRNTNIGRVLYEIKKNRDSIAKPL